MKHVGFLVVLVALLILMLAPSAAEAQRRHGVRVQPSFPQALGANVGMRAFPSVAVPPDGFHFQFGGHFGTPSFHGRRQHKRFRFHQHPRFKSHPHFRQFHGKQNFRQKGFSFGFHSPGLTIIIR